MTLKSIYPSVAASSVPAPYCYSTADSAHPEQAQCCSIWRPCLGWCPLVLEVIFPNEGIHKVVSMGWCCSFSEVALFQVDVNSNTSDMWFCSSFGLVVISWDGMSRNPWRSLYIEAWPTIETVRSIRWLRMHTIQGGILLCSMCMAELLGKWNCTVEAAWPCCVQAFAVDNVLE